MRAVLGLPVLEARLYRCLWRWLRRVRPGPTDFSYRSRSLLGVVLVFMLFVTPFEIVIPAILLPWAWLKWTILIADVYALLWFAGLHASLVVLPYRLEETGLRLRYG